MDPDGQNVRGRCQHALAPVEVDFGVVAGAFDATDGRPGAMTATGAVSSGFVSAWLAALGVVLHVAEVVAELAKVSVRT